MPNEFATRRNTDEGDALPILRLEELDDGLQLILDDLGGLIGFTFLQCLTHAEDYGKAVIEGDTGLLGYKL